jgi:hypothetical protein
MSRYILHRHEAIKRGLHWDVRFQIPNSKNWASFSTSKEIPTKPNERIYIVRSNDHSEKEALYTGTIPSGEYGAGKLIKIEDGDCDIRKYTNSHIIIDFKGKVLHGVYHIINVATFGKRRDYSKKVYAFFKAKEDTNLKENYDYLSEYLEKLNETI